MYELYIYLPYEVWRIFNVDIKNFSCLEAHVID